MLFFKLSQLLFLASAVQALDTGVGKLPKLGYDTWNAFGCNYDASLVLEQAMMMKKHGLTDLGYNIIILDDCYAEYDRDKHGNIVANKTKFPEGMEYFAGQVSQYDVSLAAYSSNGYWTCAGYPGGYGHEMQDLATFHSWGMSYLKYDNCNSSGDNITRENEFGRYQRMTDAIAKFATETGTMFEFGLCEWGWEMPWVWAAKLGQAWRIFTDVEPYWWVMVDILELQSYVWYGSGFYGHNDMDMLEVGNTGPGTLNYEETKTHFTAWALLKSPLIIGTDLTNATQDTLDILSNKDLLRINQDPNEPQSVYPFRGPGNWEYWAGNSTYGAVFMIINSNDTAQDMFFTLTESFAIRAGIKYHVYDMWSHTHNGTAVTNMTLTAVPPHGVVALLLTPAGFDGIDGTCFMSDLCVGPDGMYLPGPDVPHWWD